MADGLTPASYVNIPTVSSMPVGLSTLDVVLARTLTLIVISPYARLAQIVESRPYDVADDVGIVFDISPVLEGITRITLRLPHHALRVALMVGGMLMHHVVVAGNIEYLEMRVGDFPIIIPCAEGFGDGSCPIALQHGCLEFSRCGYDGYILALNNLVANAP